MDITKCRTTIMWVIGFVFVVMMMQLAAPFMLGTLVYSASIVLPLAGYYYLMYKKWKIDMDPESKQKNASKDEALDEVHVSKHVTRPETAEETVCDTEAWYVSQGRERILGIMKRLDLKHISSFSIQKDGLCMARYPNGVRRCGVLPGYQEISELKLIMLLRGEGFYVERHRSLLCLSWGVERSKAA